MNIHEYQAKELLAKYGVPVQPGGIAYTAAEAEAVLSRARCSNISTPTVTASSRLTRSQLLPKISLRPTSMATAPSRSMSCKVLLKPQSPGLTI